MASVTVGNAEESILRRLEDDQSEESEQTDQNLINEIAGEQDDDSEETLVGGSDLRDVDSESDSEDSSSSDSSSSSHWHGGHHDKLGEGHMLSHNEHHHGGERIGKAAGVGVAAIAVVALAGLALFCFMRRRRRRAARSLKNADSKITPESNSNNDVANAGVWVVAGAPLPEGYAYAKPPPELEGAMPGKMYALPEPAAVATGGMAPDVAVGVPVEHGEAPKVCVQGHSSGSCSSGAAAGENPAVACGV